MGCRACRGECGESVPFFPLSVFLWGLLISPWSLVVMCSFFPCHSENILLERPYGGMAEVS